MPAAITIQSALATLGKFELRIGSRLAPPPPTHKARALVALLVLQQGRDVARERLIELFWGEFEVERAREGLRTALSSIRRALRSTDRDPDDWLFTDKSVVRWLAETDLDAARLEELARSDALDDKRAALRLYGGDFLEGSYEDWAVRERDRIAGLYEAALADLVTRAGDVDAAHALLERNPFHEEAYATQIEAQLRANRPAAAAELMAQYRRAMREISATPSAEFQRRFANVQDPATLERAARGIDVSLSFESRNGETSFPAHLTSFVGRHEDLSELKRLILTSRLVTVTGSGGIGKTRLAAEAVAALQREFRNGVWFVDMAAVSSPQATASAIAAALRVFDSCLDRALQETIIIAIHNRDMLLVLDNCEHLLPDLAQTVAALLLNCPDIRILCTSREPLKIEGEEALRLSGLPSRDAIALFAERARAAVKQFELNSQNMAVVGAICKRLDGIPLAIELAAPRVGVLSLKQLERLLEEHFRILASEDSLTLSRHRTVRALIDWSYDLLSPNEQRLLLSTSVFIGGFTLEAAAAVSGLADEDALDILSTLVAKSLVLVEADSERARYSLLQTTQQYAHEKLLASSELPRIRERHARYYLELARRADETYGNAKACEWLQSYRPEIGNIRAAIEFACESGDVCMSAELTAATRELWQELGLYAEGLQRAQQALDSLDDDASPAVRAELWLVIAQLGNVLYRTTYALEAARNASVTFERIGDETHLAYALQTLGFSLIRHGVHDEAETALLRAQALAERLGNRRIVARALLRRGHNAQAAGACEAALVLYERCLQLARSMEDELYIGYALGHLATVYFALRDLPRSISYGRAAREIFQRRKDSAKEANALANLAECHYVLGELAQAKETARASIGKALESKSTVYGVYSVQHLAAIAAAESRPQTAARLIGYVEAAIERLALMREYGDAYTRDRAMEALREQLTDAELQRLLAEGSELSDEEAFTLAIAAEAAVPDALNLK